jgi:hypothetical protein
MPKRIVTMHELETTRWTLQRLEHATPEELRYIRRIIAQENSGPRKDSYNAFLTRLLSSVDVMKNRVTNRREP